MTFGIKYFAEMRSEFKGIFWRVEIAERGYTGAHEEMTFNGEKPLSIVWEKRGDEFFVPVKGSEATINILCKDNFHYLGLFTADPRKFRVSVYRNTKLYWRGYVVSDLYSENFTAPPYDVTIKAVDGFNLLSGIPFIGVNNDITGKKPLWDLLLCCIDLLELDVSIADWMDLYADTMDENFSPLRQVYVDMDRFYKVYEKATYRDVLELCLRPFAAQIFQSNGALHIRRAISLYRSSRPLSFYEIGSDFPTGWLITADGRTIVTEKGEPIITQASRDAIDSMWDDTIHVHGDSDLDILPAVRNINITVSNKLLDNIIDNIGMYDEANWDDPHGLLRIGSGAFILTGNDKKNEAASYKGHQITQCAMKLNFSVEFNAIISRMNSTGQPTVPSDGVELPIEYGFKIFAKDKIYYLCDNGEWSESWASIKDKIKLSEGSNRKIEINGFPESGKLTFFIIQTLAGWSNDRASYYERVYFNNMTISKENNDQYEDSLEHKVAVNLSNNLDLDITLPIADIPNIPNNSLLYSLYLTDKNGKATRAWRNKGMNDYNTLVNHIVSSTLLYKQQPTKRIGGNMFTGKHIDMNTVVQDDKYLNSGFYVNSIDLDCVADECGSELVEMPGLLRDEKPPLNDDCIEVYNTVSTIKYAIKLDGYIVVQLANGGIYRMDTATKSAILLYNTTANAQIYEGDSSVIVVDGAKIVAVNSIGAVIKTHSSIYSSIATFTGGYIYKVMNFKTYSILNRPDFKYINISGGYNRPGDYLATNMEGEITSMHRSQSTIAVNTTKRSYIHDSRVNFVETMNIQKDGSEIKSISDYFLTMNLNSSFEIHRRDSLTDSALIKTIPGKVDCASHTMGQVAFSQGEKVSVWKYATTDITNVKNLAGVGSRVKNVLYVNGDLYIIREKSIYKLIV